MAAELLADFIERHELAKTMNITTRTIDRWYTRRIGPPRIAIGKQIYYRRDGVIAWLNSREVGKREPRTVRKSQR